jgi:hypothetical protein
MRDKRLCTRGEDDSGKHALDSLNRHRGGVSNMNLWQLLRRMDTHASCMKIFVRLMDPTIQNRETDEYENAFSRVLGDFLSKARKSAFAVLDCDSSSEGGDRAPYFLCVITTDGSSSTKRLEAFRMRSSTKTMRTYSPVCCIIVSFFLINVVKVYVSPKLELVQRRINSRKPSLIPRM